jgi:exopolyphosphatase/guanosine-5'-triphosphate,3'-diphosphate pyrophosphatase
MRIAAIDVGSNSVHMIVCRVGPDLSFEVIDREKDMIRLGASGFEGRKLPDTNIQTALQTLSKFRRLAESHGVEEIIAAATSAVRESENGGDFIRAARRELGMRVRVISGTEEARLIHRAAAYAAGLGRHPAVVIDIGGGSTEITLGTAARAEFVRSFKLGVLRLTERFARNDPLTDADERRLVRHIRRQVGGYIRQLRQRGFERVIGTSGTILSLGSLADESKVVNDVRNARVATRAIRRLRKRLVPMKLDERLEVPGLDPRRADVAAVGAVLLDTLLTALRADEVTLCDFALREGLVLDYIKKNAAHIRTAERYPDVRRRSVIELAERCRYWPEHARQVTRLALDLFDATQSRHELGAREREWLEYAGLLHDIGSHIGYEDHHKHGYYLIRHGGLRGFEPEEVVIIGLVARYHRKATPKKSHEGFADLPGQQRSVVRLLSAFLRLAEGLDRSHAQTVSGVSVDDDGDAIRVHLQAADDAELELWAAARRAAPLSSLLGVDLSFDTLSGKRRRNRPPKARAARPAKGGQPAGRRRQPGP